MCFGVLNYLTPFYPAAELVFHVKEPKELLILSFVRQPGWYKVEAFMG